MRDVSSSRLFTWLFFDLVFGLSWGFWALAALSSARGAALPTRLLHYVGGLVPRAETVVLIYLRHTPGCQRDFWQRALEFKRIGRRGSITTIGAARYPRYCFIF